MQFTSPRHRPNFQPRGFTPPVSNTERQREFRERNPHYYRDLQRRRRAELNASVVLSAAKAAFMKRALLLLPAPVQTLEIPGVNAIPTREQLAAMHALREAA